MSHIHNGHQKFNSFSRLNNQKYILKLVKMWNDISLLSEEKVVNNVFSINSLFRITNSSEDSVPIPSVKSTIFRGHIAIGIDESLILFGDESFKSCNYLCLGANIDCLTISANGALAICALSNGLIYGIHYKGVSLFSVEIDPDHVSVKGERTFVDIHRIGEDFFLICEKGFIYKISNIENDEINNTINELDENKSSTLNETMSNNVLIDLISSQRLPSVVSAFSATFHDNLSQPLLILSTKEFVYIKCGSSTSKVPLPVAAGTITKIQTCPFYVLALTNNGTLYELCMHSSLMVLHSTAIDEKIIDIKLTGIDEQIELEVITKSQATGSKMLKIFSFPEMECKLAIDVSESSWIIDQQDSSANVYYLNGAIDTKSIELKSISEIDPEKRLNTLINKGLLDEAESFANAFKLSVQPVYEAKVHGILSKIGENQRNDVEAIERLFDDLIETAKKISSTEFLLKMRSLDMHNRRIMKKFLQFLMKYVKFDNYPNEFEEINEQLLRLETLRMIDMYECDIHWQKFVNHSNLINYCFKFFETDISIACLILRQHASSILPQLKEMAVTRTLDEIPKRTELFDIIQLMRHYLPLVSKTFPQSLPKLTDWIIRKIALYQMHLRWPEIGLEFAGKMLKIFREVEFPFPDSRRQYDVCIERLQEIIDHLEELAILKLQFNLRLSYESYLQDTPEESASSILTRISLQNLGRIISEFLYPIFNEKGKELIPALVRYVDFLIDCRRNYHVWEDRAVATTLAIHNEEVKLKCAIKILKNASVPWSKSVDPLVKYRSSNHPLASEISYQCHLQKLKILKKKYGWKVDTPIERSVKFLRRMIKVNDNELIKDVNEFTEGNAELRLQAHFYCPYEMAHRGFVDRAIAYIERLNDEECQQCCQQMYNIGLMVIEDELDNPNAFEQILEMMKFLFGRSRSPEHKDAIKILISMQALHRDIKIIPTMRILRNRTEATELKTFIEKCLDEVVISLRKLSSGYVHHAWTTLGHIASLARTNIAVIAMQLVKKIDNINFTCGIAKCVLYMSKTTNVDSAVQMKFVLELLWQQFKSFDSAISNNLFVSLSYPLAYALLSQSNRQNLEACELFSFVRIGNHAFDLDRISNYLESDIDNGEDQAISYLFESSTQANGHQNNKDRRSSMNIFEEVLPTANTPKHEHRSDAVLKCLSLTLAVIMFELKPKTCFYDNFEDTVTAPVNFSQNDFYDSLFHLIKMKEYSSAFAIIEFIRCQQSTSNRRVMPKELVSNCLRKMIKSSLHQKEPNFEKILLFLKADPDPEECLDNLKRDLNNGMVKINVMTLEGKFNSQGENSEKRQSRLKHFYFMQLCQFDPTLKSKANFNIGTFEKLFDDFNIKIIDVHLLERMSNDFDWNFQKVLVYQICKILMTQELDFDTTTDLMGKEQIMVKITAQKIRSLCQPYLERVTDVRYLANKLYELMNSVNSYFYELYLCILDILKENDFLQNEMQLWPEILLFLKHKMIEKRSKRPTQLETDWWLKTQNETGVLPRIARYRFPFQMLVENRLKEILDEEVNVENVTLWFPLVQLCMNMQGTVTLEEIYQQQDYFCLSAVKNSIAKYKAENDGVNGDAWNLQPVNNAFLQSIMLLITEMKDKKRILFVLYVVCSHTPDGADQVEAAFECYRYALENEEELNESERAAEMVKKIKRKYPVYKTQHLLHLYRLKDDSLTHLIEMPLELINTLYERITENVKVDINQVCREIANLHFLDFGHIQKNLLEKWLGATSQESNESLEGTFCHNLDDTTNQIDENFDLELGSVHSAYYILRSWDRSDALNFLASHVFQSDDENLTNTGRQLQVLDCLIKLVNEDTERTFAELVSPTQYVALKCVHYLQGLGFKLSIRKFQTYDKMRILKQIWSTNANNPKALEVIVYICIGYEIYEPIIWNNLLKQMVNLHMTKELQKIIEIISIRSKLLHIDGLVVAWEYLMRLPLKDISNKRSAEQDELVSRTLFMLQSVPIKMKMNLMEIAELFVRMNQIHAAAILIAFIDDQQKAKLVAMLQELKLLETQAQREDLRKTMNDLCEYGIYPFVVNLAISELKL